MSALSNTATTSPTSRDGTIVSVGAFQAWLNTAPAGDAITWHEGFLARQRKPWTELRGHRRQIKHPAVPGLNTLARAVARAADRGDVVLLQKRVGASQYVYRAIRSTPPAPRVIPEGAKGGGCYGLRNRAAELEARP